MTIAGRVSGNSVIPWLLFIILPLTSIVPFANYILLAAILMLLIFLMLKGNALKKVLVLKTGKENTGTINILFYLMIMWFVVVAILVKPEFECLVRIVQMIGCFLAFNLGASRYCSRNSLERVQKMLCIILIIALVFWLGSGLPKGYSFYFGNPNSFASLLLTCLLFTGVSGGGGKPQKITLTVVLLLLFATSSRAAMLGAFTYITISFLLMRDSRKQVGRRSNGFLIKWKFCFTVFLIVAFAFVVIYPSLAGTDLGNKLQLLSWKYFRKNFFSGRQELWRILLFSIKNKPIAGYGLGALPMDFMNAGLSSHNLFIQVALQSGVIGLGVLLIILNRIYLNCLIHNNSTNSLHAAAAMYAMIIHENFEISLTQNYLIAGLQFWFIFGMGCAESCRYRKNELSLDTLKKE